MPFRRSSIQFVFLMLQLLLFSSSSSSGTKVETHRLEAIADVTLGSSYNLNYRDYLSVGKETRLPLARSLLKFEDIPESCKYVEKAEVVVYYFAAHRARWQNDMSAPFVFRQIQVRQVLKDWKEAEATQKYRMGDVKWKKQYLEYNDTDAATDADDSLTLFPDTPFGYVKLDITPTAQRWFAGEDNFGVILSVVYEFARGREIRFYSREREDESEEVKPYLSIKCWTDYCAPDTKRRGDWKEGGEGEDGGGRGGGGGMEGGESRGEKKMTSGSSGYMIPANTYITEPQQ